MDLDRKRTKMSLGEASEVSRPLNSQEEEERAGSEVIKTASQTKMVLFCQYVPRNIEEPKHYAQVSSADNRTPYRFVILLFEDSFWQRQKAREYILATSQKVSRVKNVFCRVAPAAMNARNSADVVSCMDFSNLGSDTTFEAVPDAEDFLIGMAHSDELMWRTWTLPNIFTGLSRIQYEALRLVWSKQRQQQLDSSSQNCSASESCYKGSLLRQPSTTTPFITLNEICGSVAIKHKLPSTMVRDHVLALADKCEDGVKDQQRYGDEDCLGNASRFWNWLQISKAGVLVSSPFQSMNDAICAWCGTPPHTNPSNTFSNVGVMPIRSIHEGFRTYFYDRFVSGYPKQACLKRLRGMDWLKSKNNLSDDLNTLASKEDLGTAMRMAKRTSIVLRIEDRSWIVHFPPGTRITVREQFCRDHGDLIVQTWDGIFVKAPFRENVELVHQTWKEFLKNLQEIGGSHLLHIHPLLDYRSTKKCMDGDPSRIAKEGESSTMEVDGDEWMMGPFCIPCNHPDISSKTLFDTSFKTPNDPNGITISPGEDYDGFCIGRITVEDFVQVFEKLYLDELDRLLNISSPAIAPYLNGGDEISPHGVLKDFLSSSQLSKAPWVKDMLREWKGFEVMMGSKQDQTSHTYSNNDDDDSSDDDIGTSDQDASIIGKPFSKEILGDFVNRLLFTNTLIYNPTDPSIPPKRFFLDDSGISEKFARISSIYGVDNACHILSMPVCLLDKNIIRSAWPRSFLDTNTHTSSDLKPENDDDRSKKSRISKQRRHLHQDHPALKINLFRDYLTDGPDMADRDPLYRPCGRDIWYKMLDQTQRNSA